MANHIRKGSLMGSHNLGESAEAEINEASLRSITARELENNFSARKKEAL